MMSEIIHSMELYPGSPSEPEPLLPMLALLIPLAEINSAIAACRELHGLAITEDATAYLEGELIDENVQRLFMTPVAIVEWGPTGWVQEDYHASIYTLHFPAHGELVVVRWWNEIPKWWSYGDSVAELEVVIELLERKVGRSCNRVVWQSSYDGISH